MQTILGPFHPYLENALVEEILRCKKEALLCPLLILVPSGALRRRLKILLARERGLNLLNLHILTFHQFSLTLLEERFGGQAPAAQDGPVLEEILRRILRMGLPGAEPFAGLEEKTGGCAALWQTLRDLKDGAVNPAVALEAVRANLFEEGTESVERLLNLFQTLLSCCEKWRLRDYADLDLLALEQVPASSYLGGFNRIFYYGFYDLTQVQLDLFQSVARSFPTTLLFPLVQAGSENPAWAFAQRFYERYVHGLDGGQSQTRNLVSAEAPFLSLFSGAAKPLHKPQPGAPPITVFSCFGGREEIDTTAKEILRLVTEENFSFSEIGVVGRTLDPYLPWIKEVFTDHAIPIVTSAEEPLVQHPPAKAALLLVHLPLRDYVRSHVIDLLDSPFFKVSSAQAKVVPRSDLWDLFTRRMGIGKGIDDWRRLENHLAADLAAESADDGDEPKKTAVPADQVRALWHIFTELHGDLECLPGEASWSRYADLWKDLQEKWLDLSTDRDASQGQAGEMIGEILARLSLLDVAGEEVSLSHFLETYRRWLERATVPVAGDNAEAVAVLDAMAARGVPFRALFIIGLNEGLFPRTIREDAFLRDRERELFETVLGYKVAAKLGGFDEERLLFTLLVTGAKEKLYCLRQRNDESGRPVAPSWYLDELVRALGRENVHEVILPRGAVERESFEPFNRTELLPPGERAIRLILTAKDPMPLARLCLPASSLYERGSAVIGKLEATTEPLGEHDGFVGALSGYWRRVAEEGFSPTALEVYARCPFQFFARNLLGLERLERPEDVAGPGAADLGQIVHSILKTFYQELIDCGYFSQVPSMISGQAPLINSGQAHSTDSGQAAAILRAVTQRGFQNYEKGNAVGYPLAWEVMRDDIATLLEQAVASDLQELAESGYVPWALECDAVVRLPESWPAPLNGLTIRGRMDRIDRRPEDNRYRVVDYKLKPGKSRQPADSDLLRSAMRGLRLQPPFYLLLGKQHAEAFHGTPAAVEAAFYFLAPQWSEGPLVVESLAGDVWDGPCGGAFKETVAFLVESIRRGFFFIQPDDYCRYCEVSEVCRRNHRPTLWRAERDLRCQAHLDLKDKKADTDGSGESGDTVD